MSYAIISLAIEGAVAQLGERRVRNAKVGSSILLRSTRKAKEYSKLKLQ